MKMKRFIFMARFICIFLILILITGGCKVDPKLLADLEAKAEKLDEVNTITAHEYVDTYFKLAEAYLQMGAKNKAMEALKKGLRLESWNYKYQLLLAKLEIEAKQYTDALERLQFVNRFCTEKIYLSEAQKLLKKPKLKIDLKQGPSPILPGYKLYIVQFENISPVLVVAVASRIFQEFGIQVEIMDKTLKPDSTNIRTRQECCEKYYDRVIADVKKEVTSAKYDDFLNSLGISKITADSYKGKEAIVHALYLQDPDGETLWKQLQESIKEQYNADNLLVQIEQECKEQLEQKNVVGILGITADDLYIRDYNFLFGNAEPKLGVISYARFVDSHTSLNIEIKRTVMQAFSSVGFILGIPRCTTPTCARAYPHSLAEHDRKEDRLCRICIENLRKRYEEISKQASL